MTPVGSANSSDFGGVAGCRKPVVDRRSDSATLYRRLAWSMVAGD